MLTVTHRFGEPLCSNLKLLIPGLTTEKRTKTDFIHRDVNGLSDEEIKLIIVKQKPDVIVTFYSNTRI